MSNWDAFGLSWSLYIHSFRVILRCQGSARNVGYGTGYFNRPLLLRFTNERVDNLLNCDVSYNQNCPIAYSIFFHCAVIIRGDFFHHDFVVKVQFVGHINKHCSFHWTRAASVVDWTCMFRQYMVSKTANLGIVILHIIDYCLSCVHANKTCKSRATIVRMPAAAATIPTHVHWNRYWRLVN